MIAVAIRRGGKIRFVLFIKPRKKRKGFTDGAFGVFEL